MPTTVLFDKAELTQHKQLHEEWPPLGEGEVRLRVESFSVTANNVTYALFGDGFGYWNFFPGQGGHGVVPMWGHAVVEESRHPDIAVGERVYGYLPMGSHLDVLPADISAGGFTDAAAHRQPMSPIYNRYSRIAADPEHQPDKEAERMIFGPLFKTGFLIEAMFRREAWYGAQNLIVTSASSKTAMATIHCTRISSPHIHRIGLTSAGNVDFVRSTGLYDEVLSYDDVGNLPQAPSVSVDFAGNSALLYGIHSTLGDQLKYSCTVGATHVGHSQGTGDLPGPAPILFFAPDHAVATLKELGPQAFGEAVARSWTSFLDAVAGSVQVDERAGLDAAADAFVQTLAGKADPAVGIIIRP